MLADEIDHRSSEALFSNCGSFCFLRCSPDEVAILSSELLEKRQARMQMPTVWDWKTSHNGRFYEFDWRDEPTMIQLYQAIDPPHKDDLRDSLSFQRPAEQTIAVNITAFPSHLVFARPYLLVGKSGDDLVRVLFLPAKGPPEIKHLRVTMNQILAELEVVAKAIAPNIEKLVNRKGREKGDGGQ